jgi:aryl-alcohol dehydrogenase-like predicted oxidoreductase
LNYRQFGNTDLKVSEIGFGAWAIGGNAMIGKTAIGWGKSDDDVSKTAIHAALDAGVNFFDTADIYGLGHSEELLGKTLPKHAIVASKSGNVDRNGEFTVDYSKQYIISACEASLKRLKRDVIDFHQLHTARIEHLQNGECIEAMETLKNHGKIRYWGISLNTFAPLPEAEYFLENKIGNGFQLVFNLINQRALPILNETKNNYGIIARMPLQFGLLTGKFDSEFHFDKDDHRSGRITKEIVEQANKVLHPVWQLREKYEMTKTELALSYILSKDFVSTVITGIRTPEHVQLNTSGLKRLDKADIEIIENAEGLNELMDAIQKQG